MNGDRPHYAFSHDVGLWIGQKIQGIQLLLTAPFLNDADNDVGDHNTHKCQVEPRAYRNNGRRQHKEDQVKIGKYIRNNNILQ